MSEQNFSYRSRNYHVFFGEGQIKQLAELVGDNDRVFTIVSKRNQAEIEKALEGKSTHLFTDIVQHVPQSLVYEALSIYKNEGCTLLLALGGGSAIGLAKALALQTDDVIIAVPTTYAGSEMTNIWGITGIDGTKTTGRNDVVMPRHIIYDLHFTKTLPKKLAVTSAFNAMAHLVEAVYAPDGNPVTTETALLGIEKLMAGLTTVADHDGLTTEGNEYLTAGAFLAGKALGEVSMSLHHKAAHVLGGTFKLEHSHVHTVLLPFVLNYQWPALSASVQSDFQQAFGTTLPSKKIMELQKNTGAPTNLKEIGFEERQIEKAVQQILAKPYANPREITPTGLMKMLTNAFRGKLI